MPFPTNINRGEPFVPGAERENAVNRLLNEVQTMPQILSGQHAAGAKKGNQYVRIYNGISQPIPAFAPVKIGKLMKSPVKGDCGDFLTDRYVFEYERPASEDDIIGIVTNKIENKGLGLALIYGVMPLSCKVNDKDDKFLKLVPGEGSQLPSLETSSNGFAPLLWCDTNTGADKFCMASLGLGGVGMDVRQCMIEEEVTDRSLWKGTVYPLGGGETDKGVLTNQVIYFPVQWDAVKYRNHRTCVSAKVYDPEKGKVVSGWHVIDMSETIR